MRISAFPIRLSHVILLLGTLGLCWAVASLTWPIGFDHGLYVWVTSVVLDGGLQYRDAWDMHGPAVGYLLAIPIAIFGQHSWSLRVLDLVMLLLGVWGLWRTVSAVNGIAAARWSVVIFVLVYASFGFNETGQPDGWVALLSIAVFAPLLSGNGKSWVANYLIPGLFIGVFTLVKPLYAVFGLIPVVAHVAHSARESTTPKGLGWIAMRSSLLLALLSFVPIGLTVVYFRYNGALTEFLDVHIRYTSAVYGGTASFDVSGRMAGLADFLFRGKLVAVALPLALVGMVASIRRSLPYTFPLLVWALLALAVAIIQNKWYAYHLIPLYPPLFIFCVVAVWDLLASTDARARILALVTAGVLVVHTAVRPAAAAVSWARYASGLSSRQTYLSGFQAGPTMNAADQHEAAEHIRRTTPANSAVAVWGYDAGVIYLAQRKTPFRQAGWIWPIITGPQTIRSAYQTEYYTDFARTLPDMFVVNLPMSDAPNRSPLLIDSLATLLHKHYTRDTTFGTLQLYRRVPPAGGGVVSPIPDTGSRKPAITP